MPMIRFVTGTGVGVGKTVATAVLARRDVENGKRVAYLKPVETGAGPDDIGDAAFIADAVGIPTHEALRFSARLDPALAAEQGAVSIGLDWLVDLARAHASAVADLFDGEFRQNRGVDHLLFFQFDEPGVGAKRIRHALFDEVFLPFGG